MSKTQRSVGSDHLAQRKAGIAHVAQRLVRTYLGLSDDTKKGCISCKLSQCFKLFPQYKVVWVKSGHHLGKDISSTWLRFPQKQLIFFSDCDRNGKLEQNFNSTNEIHQMASMCFYKNFLGVFLYLLDVKTFKKLSLVWLGFFVFLCGAEIFELFLKSWQQMSREYGCVSGLNHRLIHFKAFSAVF